MKEIIKYICGICGREYKDKEECLKCEGKHNIPKEILDWEAGTFLPDLTSRTINPETIRIRMQNGNIETYIRYDLYYKRRL